MATRNPSRPRPKPANTRRARAAARERARRRWTLAATIAAALAVLATVAGLAFSSGSGGTSSAAYAADKQAFDLPALSGNGHVRLADHRGRPVVVNFFASWCVYCNEELPGFVQVAKATHGQVDFIGVDTSETGDGAAMAKRFDLAGAGFALAKDIGPSPASELWSSFGARGLPVTAFYDAQGRVVDFSPGMLTQAELQQRLQQSFGVQVQAPDAATLSAPVIPLIPRGAYELLRTHVGDSTFHVLDVRTPEEFAGGHVEGAKNIDFYAKDFANRLRSLDKDASYVVYCHTGNRSGQATTLMHQLGFKHVYDVQGGIAAWQQAGLPTVP